MTNAPPTVDRLWPDPRPALTLDEAFADVAPAPRAYGRPYVTINMVTSVDGRAQLRGTAEGLGSRADRRLMQLYRAAYDAVGSGAGTLRADDFYSHLAADLAERRQRAGRMPQPLSLVVAGTRPIPTKRRWLRYPDQRRVLAVGAGNPQASEPLPGVETWVAQTSVPEPAWLLERLAAAGVGSLLIEGGPTINAAFLAAGLIDEVLWTIGARLVGAPGLPMIAPLPVESLDSPREAQLRSVHRSGDELYLRYSIGP